MLVGSDSGLKVKSYNAVPMPPDCAIHFLAGYLDAIQRSDISITQDHINDIATCVIMCAGGIDIRYDKESA